MFLNQYTDSALCWFCWYEDLVWCELHIREKP